MSGPVWGSRRGRVGPPGRRTEMGGSRDSETRHGDGYSMEEAGRRPPPGYVARRARSATVRPLRLSGRKDRDVALSLVDEIRDGEPGHDVLEQLSATDRATVRTRRPRFDPFKQRIGKSCLLGFTQLVEVGLSEAVTKTRQLTPIGGAPPGGTQGTDSCRRSRAADPWRSPPAPPPRRNRSPRRRVPPATHRAPASDLVVPGSPRPA